MNKLKPYPTYKDSGVEWIGEIPVGWEVTRIKRVSSLRNERCNNVPDGSTYIGLEDVAAESGQYKPSDTNSRQSEDSTVNIFYKGDVLYGKLRPYLKKAIVANLGGACSTEFLVLRTEKIVPYWLHQWLLTPDVTCQIEAGCEGAKMPRAGWGHIGAIEVVFPPLSEQQAIATFLDSKTARIDELVEKKTRAIELLREKRQAMITQAVTKGLDPNAKMQDSGVEWIGEVPEGWQVAPFFSIGSEQKIRNTGMIEDNLLSLSYGNIVRRNINTNEGLLPESFETYQIVNAGYIVFRLTDLQNDQRSLRSAIVKEKGIITSAYIAVSIKAGSISYYYNYLFRAYDVQKVFYTMGAGLRQSLKYDDLKRIPILIPPLSEQKAIAAFLDEHCAKIDALMAKIERSIELLKEKRQALITAAVTGKIDVRGLAPQVVPQTVPQTVSESTQLVQAGSDGNPKTFAKTGRKSMSSSVLEIV